jgi:hypothetical protein
VKISSQSCHTLKLSNKRLDPFLDPNDPSGTVVIGGPDGMAAALKLIQDGKPINYDGAGGPQDFDAVGNVKGDYVLYEVRNRQFVDVKRYNCIADPKCPEI